MIWHIFLSLIEFSEKKRPLVLTQELVPVYRGTLYVYLYGNLVWVAPVYHCLLLNQGTWEKQLQFIFIFCSLISLFLLKWHGIFSQLNTGGGDSIHFGKSSVTPPNFKQYLISHCYFTILNHRKGPCLVLPFGIARDS